MSLMVWVEKGLLMTWFGVNWAYSEETSTYSIIVVEDNEKPTMLEWIYQPQGTSLNDIIYLNYVWSAQLLKTNHYQS
jgi:hypothetical protein